MPERSSHLVIEQPIPLPSFTAWCMEWLLSCTEQIKHIVGFDLILKFIFGGYMGHIAFVSRHVGFVHTCWSQAQQRVDGAANHSSPNPEVLMTKRLGYASSIWTMSAGFSHSLQQKLNSLLGKTDNMDDSLIFVTNCLYQKWSFNCSFVCLPHTFDVTCSMLPVSLFHFTGRALDPRHVCSFNSSGRSGS